MEYLTLQDIPHRHCNPVHSHRMASQSSERPLGNMVAAVCKFFDSFKPLPDSPLLFLPPIHHARRYDFASHIESTPDQNIPLRNIILPELADVPRPTSIHTHRGFECDLFRSSLKSDMDHTFHDYASYANSAERSQSMRKRYYSWCNAKTKSQNQLQRSSPPLQPGEQNFPGKLPSFDEVGSTHETIRAIY